MSTTKMARVGNGQALYVPKAICDEAGAAVGDSYEVRLVGKSFLFTPVRPRRRRLTATEVFGDWGGGYEPPADFPTEGTEVACGGPVGSEMW